MYSSYAIEKGTFVSPSRMEAESYSGDGTVYSRTVRLEDVAWIDPTQGQYTGPASRSAADRVTKGRSYSYTELTAKKDMPVSIVDDTVAYPDLRNGRETVVDEALKNARIFGLVDEHGRTFVHVSDTNRDVLLSRRGLRHGLDRRFGINAPVTVKCGEILSKAICINELYSDRAGVDEGYVLIGVAKNKNNEPYIVQFVVNRASNEVTSIDVLNAINAKTEPAGSLSPEITGEPATLTDSMISIASLLDYVNKYFPDVLSMDVLRHFGRESRPKGKVGGSAKFSRVVDSEEDLQRENEELRKQVKEFEKGASPPVRALPLQTGALKMAEKLLLLLYARRKTKVKR